MVDLGHFLNVNNEDRSEVDKDSLTEKWKGYLSDPRAQGAMLSMAGALAQPSWSGGMGHVMGALGAGGESVRQSEALDIKQQEADSKEALRASQADLAGSRAQTAGASAAHQTDKLGMQRLAFEHKTSQDRLSNIFKTQGAYNANREVREVVARNKEAADFNKTNILGLPMKPIVPLPDKARILREMGVPYNGSEDPFVVGGEEASSAVRVTGDSKTVEDPEEGRTATNKKTGQKLIKRDGKWEPL